MTSIAKLALPLLLTRSGTVRVPDHFEHVTLTKLRSIARLWTGQATSKMSAQECTAALRPALKSAAVAARILASLNEQERAILAVYRRHGGTVNGAVLRTDLVVRGLLERVQKGSRDHPWYQWKRNPIPSLAERLLLLQPGFEGITFSYYGFGSEIDQSFPTYTLHPGLARQVEPAGPPSWTLPPLSGAARPLGQRSATEVALDLSNVFAAVAARGTLALNKNGDLAATSLRGLAKAVSLPEDDSYPLPDAVGLTFELLRGAGLIVAEGGKARPDPAAATRFFALPAAVQVHHWTRAWLNTTYWDDGLGMARGSSAEENEPPADRQILAWALGCLARASDAWFDLTAFITALHEWTGSNSRHGWEKPAWDPRWAPVKDPVKDWARARWFEHGGRILANAVIVTLVALGLVERGHAGRGQIANGFRLTPLGRAVFGAPEVAAPDDAEDQPFLVVQPNFDIVAYLDRASARSAGLLGRLAEAGSTTAADPGHVQTFRLTRESVYNALESGLSTEQVADFLRRANQGPLPANVLQTLTDWSGRREALVLRQGVTLLAFPDAARRAAWLVGNAGTACGERFVLAAPQVGKEFKRSALFVDHLEGGRQTLRLDETGLLHTDKPLDLVQRARLRRLAEPAQGGWRLTAASVARSQAGGLKPALLKHWLDGLLAELMPPLMACAFDAWQGKPHPAELADAVLLHVPDANHFLALLTSPRVRPLLLGMPGHGWLAVRPERRAELAALLGELGFTVVSALTSGGLPGARP